MEIDGIRFEERYKYLGCILERNLKKKSYIDYLGDKVRKTTNSLRNIRKHKRLRVNINLFKVLIMPWVRLGGD